MKNNKVLIAILVILIAIAGYYFVNNKSGTIAHQEGIKSDFAIEDTASIDKIFISNPEGTQVTLLKKENEWWVEGKHKARPESMNVLMNTFKKIAIKSPVSKSAFNNVVKSLATRAVKVEIYQGEDTPSKIYYVGEATQNHQGTYMLLESDGEKSTQPFVMHIPGFYGYLTTRFYANPMQWRDAAVFKYLPSEIKTIQVTYYEKPEESFTIQKNGLLISLYDNQTAEMVKNADTTVLNNYLTFFEKAYYEDVVLDMKEAKKDSILNAQPFFSLTVTDIFGKENKMVGYYMPNYKKIADAEGNIFPYDLDRMYGLYNEELFVFIQYRTFDKLLLPKAYFLKQ